MVCWATLTRESQSSRRVLVQKEALAEKVKFDNARASYMARSTKKSEKSFLGPPGPKFVPFWYTPFYCGFLHPLAIPLFSSSSRFHRRIRAGIGVFCLFGPTKVMFVSNISDTTTPIPFFQPPKADTEIATTKRHYVTREWGNRALVIVL